MSFGGALVTGGCGFIGSAVVRALVTAGYRVTNVDKLTYAGDLRAVAPVADNPHYHFIEADICDAPAMATIFTKSAPDIVLHLAAESHVDRSIDDPQIFVQTNLLGTAVLLNAALTYYRKVVGEARKKFRFIHISTDEVYGELGDNDSFSEDSPYNPRSPYAATKAGSDHLVSAWGTTYGLPAIITNCTNNYGPYQSSEKLIPTVIREALSGNSIPIYGKGLNVRDWLHVDDHAEALTLIAARGVPGQKYNIGACNQIRNIDFVNKICTIIDALAPRSDGKPYAEQITFVTDRPGHDYRYAINPAKISRTLGWYARTSLDIGLHETVAWYLQHRDWLGRGGRLGLGIGASAEKNN